MKPPIALPAISPALDERAADEVANAEVADAEIVTVLVTELAAEI